MFQFLWLKDGEKKYPTGRGKEKRVRMQLPTAKEKERKTPRKKENVHQTVVIRLRKRMREPKIVKESKSLCFSVCKRERERKKGRERL